MSAAVAEAPSQVSLLETLNAMPDRIYFSVSRDGFTRTVKTHPQNDFSVEICWDKHTGTARVGACPSPRDMAAEDLMRFGGMMSESGNVLSLFEQAHRVAHLHPVKYGLVPHADQTYGREDFRPSDGPGILSSILPHDLLPRGMDHRALGTGWFHPDADPSAFGTVYLVPVLLNAPNVHVQRHGIAGWRVRTVGMTESGPFVTWDDVDGMADAVQRTAEDPEIVATEHVLLDSVTAAQDLQRHTRRVQVLEAREAFAVKRNQVRPRLTQDAIEKAIHSYRRHDENGWNYVQHSRQDLAPYDVLGYDRTGKTLWAGFVVTVNRSRPRWTDGRSVTPEETMTQEEARLRMANELVAKVQERGLAKVALIEGGDSVAGILLTQRPDLVEQYPLAFGLPQDITLRVLN